MAIYAPSLAAPLMGVWVDRVRRRPFLIAVNVASAVALLPLLLVRTADQVWIIFVVMVAYGVSLVVVDPAENALFAVLFRDEMRQQINGLRLALQEGGKVVAPLFGAGLFALVGGGAVAAVDAATFLVAAVAVSRLELSEPSPAPPTTPWRTELAAGGPTPPRRAGAAHGHAGGRRSDGLGRHRDPGPVRAGRRPGT